MSFADLPEDVIEYIFLQLTPYNELQSVSNVCRQWNRLAKGACHRLQKLLLRCESFDWFLLMPSLETGKFSAIANAAERCSHAAHYHQGQKAVYVFGGCTASYTTFNDLWKLDLQSRSWMRPVPMGDYPSPKACATLVEYAGCLVLFGGWSKSSPNPIHQTAMFFNELHVYTPERNEWRSVGNDGRAPHLAGHSATVVEKQMIVFGGSHGSGSSNTVWIFDFPSEQWSTPPTSALKPLPRYGQSQINLSEGRILIVGGCGGPNLIFSDIWLLTMGKGEEIWTWEEIVVLNPNMAPPQIWSHPACKVGQKLLVLSRALQTQSGASGRKGSLHRDMSASQPGAVGGGRGRGRNWVPPQGNLIPPRRKLISSRSLDEHNPPPSPKSEERKVSELQRAQSIPAIIVGEIPKLVVTKEENSGESSGSDSSTGPIEEASHHYRNQCISLVGSSLLPNQAVVVEPVAQERVGGAGPGEGGRRQRSPPNKKEKMYPSVKPNGGRNREKQLEMLRRMEDYIRSRSRTHQNKGGASGSSSPDSPGTSGGSPSFRFRPSSPPPKSKYNRQPSYLQSRNPMNVYVLDISKVNESRSASWKILEDNVDAPEDTILYSLVKARGELVMFGGMRSGTASEQQGLDVTPFPRAITNETYILKPTITL